MLHDQTTNKTCGRVCVYIYIAEIMPTPGKLSYFPANPGRYPCCAICGIPSNIFRLETSKRGGPCCPHSKLSQVHPRHLANFVLRSDVQTYSHHITVFLSCFSNETLETMFATSNKCIASSNKCLTSSNKNLVETIRPFEPLDQPLAPFLSIRAYAENSDRLGDVLK